MATIHEPTRIGRVKGVLGATITVALDEDLAGVSPIFRGEVLTIGQVGSIVRIPQGLVDLIGSVSLIGITEVNVTAIVSADRLVNQGERWLQVQLVGEVHRATMKFQRGVGSFPSLDDAVHFATLDQLEAMFPPADEGRLIIGRLSGAQSLGVSLDAAKLVVRHVAVVGSTGSGKTSSVAALLQGFVKGGWKSSNIIVVDPHGEYSAALGDSARVLSVLGQSSGALHIPFWALPASEILRIFTGGAGGATFLNKFSELVARHRKEFVVNAKWLNLEAEAVTPDTPVPFDIHAVWFELDSENRETLSTKNDPSTRTVRSEGSASELRSTIFDQYGMGSAAPFKGVNYGIYGSGPDQLRLGLKDPRLQFLLQPISDAVLADPLPAVVNDWLGREKPISVLDFSGVPPAAADAAIGVVLNLLFELSMRAPADESGIGRSNPVLLVLEEAHRYLGSSADSLTKGSANRIAREGRKYGLGLWLVSQRPTELPETALAQCGTLIALRLTNGGDQSAVKASLPDDVAGLWAVLPSLRTGEAIISGEAVMIPCRATLNLPSPLPKAEDPHLERWRRDQKELSFSQSIAAWRGTYEGDKK